MKTTFRKSFARDLKNIRSRDILKRVRKVIEEVEAAGDLRGVGNLKKLGGGDHFYRIRASDYRIGVAVEADTMEFVRCLPRRDLYRFFP